MIQPPRIFLESLSWQTYQALRTPEANDGKRMTYDRGQLEISGSTLQRGRLASLIGYMILEWLLLRHIPASFGGRTTLCREDLDCGLEPDDSFWIAHEAEARGKDELDLRFDPPPDLAVEIDLDPSPIPRLPIYASIGVPELWRWRDSRLEVLVIGERRDYMRQEASKCLPDFPLELANFVLAQRCEVGSTSLMRSFRVRIAEQFGSK